MNVVKYLDEHGLETLAKILSFGRRKIWHGTRAEWDALAEDERSKYDQAEIEEVEGSAGNGSVYVVDKAEKGNMNPITSNAVANMDVDIDVTDSITSGDMNPITSNAVSKLKATVDTNTSNIATNKANIAMNTTNITNLSKTVNDHATALTSLDKAIGEAKTAASTAQTTANTAKTTADTAKSTADTAKSTADTAKSTADTNKSDISDLKTRVSALETDPILSVAWVTKSLTVSNNNLNLLPISTVNASIWSGIELKHKSGKYDYIGSININWNAAQSTSSASFINSSNTGTSYHLSGIPTTGSKYCHGSYTMMGIELPGSMNAGSGSWGHFWTTVVTASGGMTNSATGNYLRLVAYYSIENGSNVMVQSAPTPFYAIGCTSRW